MRESYEKFRMETEEIMNLIKKKAIEEDIFEDIDPDAAVLMMRCFNLLKASDKFTMACIEAMENQNEKLDRILKKLDKGEEAP